MFDRLISVLVPYKSDNGQRDENWSWIYNRYRILMPNAEICLGYYYGEPFSRSRAINNAAKKASRNIFLIADADIVFDINQMRKAVEGLLHYTWIVPYTSINYLTMEQTVELVKADHSIIMRRTDFSGCENVPCTSVYGGYDIYGGISLVPRESFEKIGGFDERFVGWGGEDDAFQKSLDAICGEHARLDTALWHLYHPLASKENRDNNRKILNEFYCDVSTIIKYLGYKR